MGERISKVSSVEQGANLYGEYEQSEQASDSKDDQKHKFWSFD